LEHRSPAEPKADVRDAAGGWWLVAGGWWLVAGGWWLVAGGWWLVKLAVATPQIEA
jgi:hypothetical protein